MRFNRDTWEKSDINNLPCPCCNKSLGYKEFMIQETERGELMQECNCTQNEYIFTGELSCTCGNYYSIHGEKNTTECEDGTASNYQIKGIFPTLSLFQFPKQCPQTVKDELTKSFALYWIDLESCGNKIRIAIELLLDALAIPTMPSLHKRIECYPDPTVKSYLLAIKWIGNTGSHADTLTQQDILDAYEMMFKVLDVLFEKTEDKLQQKANMINTTKKPISKSTK